MSTLWGRYLGSGALRGKGRRERGAGGPSPPLVDVSSPYTVPYGAWSLTSP